MNEFKESLKVNKEQISYEEYKKKRFAKEIHKEKWDNSRKRKIESVEVVNMKWEKNMNVMKI